MRPVNLPVRAPVLSPAVTPAYLATTETAAQPADTTAGPEGPFSDEILNKAKAFTGPVALGAPELQCGKYSDAPAVCNDRTQFFTYHGKNDFKKAASWLQSPQ